MKLFNTLTRQKEEFAPIDDKHVGMYTCGPTVYNYIHIGNLRAFLTYDVLKRYLEYSGYDVNHVMNITDVDDKTIRDSKAQGKTLKEFTEFYTKAFLDDIKAVNIELPTQMPRATDEIEGMVCLIKTLMDRGYAYKTQDGIYFSISKFDDYGKLANLDTESLKAGASGRVQTDEYQKENPKDFALWKFYTEDDGDVFWDTEIGKGRPGWHIECSVMSSKYLGQPFDLHMGGIDLIFPHHTNEIAQSEAACGKKFCNYWVHNEHLLIDGQKMSKSLGNFYTLGDLLKKGYSAKAIRYAITSAHYRTKMNFTEEGLKGAEKTVKSLIDFMDRITDAKIEGQQNDELEMRMEVSKKRFKESMDDDLNMPLALAAIFDLVTAVNKAVDEKNASKENLKHVYETMMEFDKVLGILEHKKEELPREILELIVKREVFRKLRNFEESDRIRKEIHLKGYDVEDSPTGTRWKKI